MESGHSRVPVRPVDALSVAFYGVRGSTPCCSPSVNRYGGNTSSVVVEAPGTVPLLLDLGTGAREYGRTVPTGDPFACRALLTHLHWDHVQGLPFFEPALVAGNRIDVHAPAPGGGVDLETALDSGIHPPFFPVTLRELPGAVVLHEIVVGEPMRFGEVSVVARAVPHIGPTVGYRLEWRDVAIAYIPDHQQPALESVIDPAVLELAADADLLIHDAQYSSTEFVTKQAWGHSTVRYAVEVARRSRVRTLALFHHDPAHDDAMIDVLADEARSHAAGEAFEVIAAAEGLRLTWPGRLG